MSDELPGNWKAYGSRKGLNSYRRLGERAGVSHETARRVVRGQSVKPATAQKVADALGVDVEVVYELREQDPPDLSNLWTPPASSTALTLEERDALARLIGVITAGRMKDGEGDGHQPAPIGESVRLAESPETREPPPAASRRQPGGRGRRALR